MSDSGAANQRPNHYFSDFSLSETRASLLSMMMNATDTLSGFRRFGFVVPQELLVRMLAGRVGQSRAGWPRPPQQKQSSCACRRAYSSMETLFRVAPSDISIGPAWVPVTAVLVFVGVAAVVSFVVVVVEVGVLQVLLVRAFWWVFRKRILLSRRWQSATHSVRVPGSRSLYARAVSSLIEMPWQR